MSKIAVSRTDVDEDVERKRVLGWVVDFTLLKNGLVKLKLRRSGEIKELLLSINQIDRLTRESAVEIEGVWNGDVLKVERFKVLVKAPEKLPVDTVSPPVDNPVIFARYSFLTIRSPKVVATLKIQQRILQYIREYLYDIGFTELLPPMISPCSDPGLRGAKKLRTTLYGREYELTSSVIMFKQAAVAALDKIFFVARNVREEPPSNLSTGRHLCEFTQIDLECAFASMWDAIKIAEGMLKHMSERLIEEYGKKLERINPSFTPFNPPFKIIKYEDAVKILEKEGIMTPVGGEFTQEGETALSNIIKAPFWIVNFPKSARGFYYLEEPDKPGYNRDFNLILPSGYGEVIDGGEREYRYSRIISRLKELGEPLEKYNWFLELCRIGIPPSSGFGLGLERLTRYILGLSAVWEATPFPKIPGVAAAP